MKLEPQYQEGSAKLLEFRADAYIPLFNAKDERVFAEIYEKLYPFAFFLARKFVPYDEAGDIVATVFGNLWSKKKEFESLEHFKRYIRVSIKNKCLEHLRSESARASRNELVGRQLYDEPNESDPFAPEAGAEKLNLIYQKIESLPGRCRDVFKMCYVDGMKNAEVAEKMGISINTVYNHKNTAIKMLRMSLAYLSFLIFFNGIASL
jgi:RNA polymerase sigma-70 factor (ECF subfamily)